MYKDAQEITIKFLDSVILMLMQDAVIFKENKNDFLEQAYLLKKQVEVASSFEEVSALNSKFQVLISEVAAQRMIYAVSKFKNEE